ncbi:MAG: trypsin-like peptidase domain-containing protein, partial [Actinobacteria bacterium]|nr:trypsin-like peptidase domain-containing protein [Actinomycetota bacterium]
MAELLFVAAVGGALALGIAALMGKLGSTTTISQVSPLAQGGGLGTVTLQPAPTKGLTPEQVYKRDASGVVQVTATVAQGDALGSGFVIDKVGHIITNYHVVQGATKVQVAFSGQDQLVATIVGTDPSTDIAVLKVDAHARALTPLALGNSDAVVVGDPVYAIGNPFGFTRTLTTGVVSALQRQIEAPNTLTIDHAIQTDAAINHGNSGGPLIDAAGRVVGVTSQISTGSTGQQGSVGIGFAVPINTVRNAAAQLIKTGQVAHAFLGINTLEVTARIARMFKLPTQAGLIVQTVQSKSGAKQAGIKGGQTPVVVDGLSYAIGGDIIVGIDGARVVTYEDLRDAVTQKRPGDKVQLEIYRQGAKR